ncbi:chorismate mutase [Candidatus Methanoplasma termitum]|uniref:chorismate mutase n=1 Tax=Candidatus Methanoplasma termitum TaxID=1577791 RepID=UPI001EE7704C|nr:chorismate mutase [Candidatus Methanoplasma termitum]MCL2333464.1 chorismate mutase [Candidatus Methanoplasma sp.]
MPSVDELRKQIESIDKDIIDLIATRMEIADELAKEKKHSSQGYWDTGVERAVIDRYMELCEDVSLSVGEAKLIAEVILKISKERQKLLYDSEPSVQEKPIKRK